MHIKHTELVDALVLTTSDIKIICCDRCRVRDKMLHWKKKYCTRNATNLELVDKLVLTKSNKFWRGIYEVIHKKIVALYVALMKKCCKVERVCVGFKRVLGDWLVLGAISSIPAMTAVWSLVNRSTFIAYLTFGLGGAILCGIFFQVYINL